MHQEYRASNIKNEGRKNWKYKIINKYFIRKLKDDEIDELDVAWW